MEDYSLFFTLLWLPLSFFILADSQLPNSQTQVLLQLKKHLEYPKQLDVWYDRRTMFCSLPPSANVNIACEFNSVTRLEIIGDKPSIKVTDFHGFPIPNQTLSDTFSMDSFVTTLSRLPSLKVLSLVSLGIWGSLPEKIHRLSSLESLDLSSNFLFGSIPPKLSTMVKLRTLVFDHNFFNDTVPNMFGSLSNLTSLSLKNNRLKGPFPFSIMGVTSLIDLDLSSNEISGELPDLSSLTHLKVLDISFNMLSGTPQAGLFSLPNTSYLNLASNMLSGSLKHKLTCGTNLGFVDISNNRLTGSLPTCLNSASSNKVVHFNGNCLSINEHQHPISYCGEKVHKINQSNPSAKGLGVSVSLIIGIAVIGVLLAIASVIICRKYCHRGISEQHLLHKSVQDNIIKEFSPYTLI